MAAPSAATRIRRRLAAGAFTRGQATVTLDGEPIATLDRTPGFIYATVLGTPWGGGRTLDTALRSVAVAYAQLRPGGEHGLR